MVSISQIGVGYWGPNLLRNLVENKKCNVCSVVDLSEDRRDFVNGLYPNVYVSADVDDVINDEKIDAVVVSTPVKTHFELTMKLLNAGKHVLVEKPMSQSVDEVKQIRDLAKKKNLVAMVGHTFLYNSAVRYLKKIIDSGDLGDIRYIYSRRLNLGRIRSDVDALWNLAPHDVSIIQYLLGNVEPISIVKHGMDYVQEGIDDVVFMNLVYPNKVMANIHISWLDPCRERRLTVVGSKKMVVYDDMIEHKIAIYDKGIDRMAILGENMDFDKLNFKLNYRSGDVFFPKIDFVEPLKVEVDHFIESIISKSTCLSDAQHALEVVKILAGDINA